MSGALSVKWPTLVINDKGGMEIYINSEKLNGVIDINVDQDMDDHRVGIARVSLTMWVNLIKTQ